MEETDSDIELETCFLDLLPDIPGARDNQPVGQITPTVPALPALDDVDDDLIVINEERGDAIDLTEGADEDFVDLTSSQRADTNTHGSDGVNDASVIVLGSMSDSPPSHRTRSRRSLQSTDSDIMIIATPDRPGPSRSDTARPGTSTQGDTFTDPFSSGDTGNTPKSPEPIKLSCPVCLDDDKQIRIRNEKIVFTKCGHMFCRPCAHSTIRVHGKCALCRKKLRMNDIFVLHM